MKGLESDLNAAADPAKGVDLSTLGADKLTDQWGDTDGWTKTRFERRYKPGPSVDELSDEIDKLKRQLAIPEAAGRSRRKYAPRARVNRPRIRR